MANKKANEPRVQMKVPVSFRDKILKEAKAHGLDATVYLENKRLYLLPEKLKDKTMSVKEWEDLWKNETGVIEP